MVSKDWLAETGAEWCYNTDLCPDCVALEKEQLREERFLYYARKKSENSCSMGNPFDLHPKAQSHKNSSGADQSSDPGSLETEYSELSDHDNDSAFNDSAFDDSVFDDGGFGDGGFGDGGFGDGGAGGGDDSGGGF